MERPNAELYRAAWSKSLTTGEVAEALEMDVGSYIQKLSVELPPEEKQRILAVIERTERKVNVKRKVCGATEVIVEGYKKIIVFRDEDMFLGALEANPHLRAIHGTKDYEKILFPGLYIAAIVTGD